MSVLVTGGSGFIGRHVVQKLVERGFKVRVFDFVKPSIEIPFFKGDIRDYDRIKEAVSGSDYVVHLAAIVSVAEAMEKPYDTVEINVIGTFNVAEACRRNGTEKLIYASSVAVYGEPRYLPVDEEHPLNPTNVYGATKLSGEAIIAGYHGNYGLKYTSLRFFNVYGPYMKSGPYSGVILSFLNRIKKGMPLKIEGDGKQTRDFVYVNDVAESILKSIESEEVGPFNIGTGRELSIIELANLLFKITGKETGLSFTDPRPGDIRRSRADISKARSWLRWVPKFSIEDGLRLTAEWFLETYDHR